MATRAINTAAQAQAAKPGVRRAAGATGLYLKKGESGAGSWFYRYSVGGRRREMGLGPLVAVTLAEARDLAIDHARALKKGVDPLEARRKGLADALARHEAEASAAKITTFGQARAAYLKDHVPSWRHERADKDWLSALKKYAAFLDDMPLNDIHPQHVAAVRRAANAAGAPYAGQRAQQRIGAVMNAAIALGWRDPTRGNPADGKLMAAVIPSRKKGARTHFRRLELEAAPAMLQRLRALAGADTRYAAWTFMIATAARPGNAFGASWSEIDLVQATWTIPGRKMKNGCEHKTPLNAVALEMLQLQAERRVSDAVFPGRGGSPISHTYFADAPKDAGLDVGSAHGWRSVYRDWIGEISRFPRDLAEAQLAHTLDATEGAYRRETAVEPRRPMMEAYAQWLEGADSNVVEFKARA
jgi:integrase